MVDSSIFSRLDFFCCVFFFNDTATTEIYTAQDTLPLHDALPIWDRHSRAAIDECEARHFAAGCPCRKAGARREARDLGEAAVGRHDPQRCAVAAVDDR